MRYYFFGGLVVAGVERQKKMESYEIICFTVDWLLNF